MALKYVQTKSGHWTNYRMSRIDSLLWNMMTYSIIIMCFYIVWDSRFELYKDLRSFFVFGIPIVVPVGVTILALWRGPMFVLRIKGVQATLSWYFKVKQEAKAVGFKVLLKSVKRVGVVYTAYGKSDPIIYTAMVALLRSLWHARSEAIVTCAMHFGERGTQELRIIQDAIAFVIIEAKSQEEKDFYRALSEKRMFFFCQDEGAGKRVAIARCRKLIMEQGGASFYVFMDGDTYLHKDTLSKSLPMMVHLKPAGYVAATVNVKASMESNELFALGTDSRFIDRNFDCLSSLKVLTGRFAIMLGSTVESDRFEQLLLDTVVEYQGIGGRAYFWGLNQLEKNFPLKPVLFFVRWTKIALEAMKMAPRLIGMTTGEDKSSMFTALEAGKVFYMCDVSVTCAEDRLPMKSGVEKWVKWVSEREWFVELCGEVSSLVMQPFRYSRNMMLMSWELSRIKNIGIMRRIQLIDQLAAFPTPAAAPILAIIAGIEIDWALTMGWFGMSLALREVKTRIKGAIPGGTYHGARPIMDFMTVIVALVKIVVYANPFGGWQRGYAEKGVVYIPVMEMTCTLTTLLLALYGLSRFG